MTTIQWIEQAPGIWRGTIGQPEQLTPLSIVKSEPCYDVLNSMGNVEFPFSCDDVDANIKNGKVMISIPLKKDEKIFGLGLQFMKMNHRGRTRYLRVNSDPKQDTGETHAPVPFYVSSEGYGLLVNTSRITTIYCGSCVKKDSPSHPAAFDRNTERGKWKATPLSDSIEVVLQSSGVELYMLAGKSMLEVVQRYNLFCGGGVLPPKWGLGFWHRVPTMHSSEQVVEEAMEFRKRKFPCDVIGLEPGWHSKAYPNSYEWSKERYPDAPQFLEKMKKEGFRINLWENPYVSPDSDLYYKLKELSGSHTVWAGLAPDYSMPEAQEILKKQHEVEHVNIGVSGYKMDECDGSELTGNSWMFPAHSVFPSGNDGEQIRQIYGIALQKALAELFHSKNQRTYGLVRASNAGASSLPFCLYSDLYDHKQFVRALCNSSFSGILWTPEVRRAKNSEDWVRRMQVVCFSPLAMLNAWSDGTKPWSYPEVEEIIRKYINLRMRLMPYIYTAFAKYYFEGIPPIRAMELENDGEVTTSETYDGTKVNSTDAAYGRTVNHDFDDQYMFGESMLVAPLFEGQTSRKVYLPHGMWYDFESGEGFQGGRTVEVSASLEKIPVFVRNGSIIPMMPALQHSPTIGEVVPLEIRHYGEAESEFNLYDDDGTTFDFEKGKYKWITLKVKKDNDGKFSGSVSDIDGNWKSSYGSITWSFIM